MTPASVDANMRSPRAQHRKMGALYSLGWAEETVQTGPFLSLELEQWMDDIQIVGVLTHFHGLELQRLICRRSIAGDERDYYVYVDRRTAAQIDRLLDERPFRILRRDTRLGTSLLYVGDSLLNGSAAPEDEETPLRERWSRRQVLYLEMRYERSRHKYRVEVPLTVIQQFHWLLGLCRHEAGSAQAIIEA